MNEERKEISDDESEFRRTCDQCGCKTLVLARMPLWNSQNGESRIFHLCRTHHEKFGIYEGYSCLRHPKTDSKWADLLRFVDKEYRLAKKAGAGK